MILLIDNYDSFTFNVEQYLAELGQKRDPLGVEPDLGARLVDPKGSLALEPLSERERDVVELLALGYTNQEIGKRLFISVRTVDTHRAHIMRKLQLDTKAELVLFALANGLIGAT